MVRTACLCCMAASTCPPEPSDYSTSTGGSVFRYDQCSLLPSFSFQPSVTLQPSDSDRICKDNKRLTAGDHVDNDPEACVAEAKNDDDCTGIEVAMVRTACLCCMAASTCPPEPSDYSTSTGGSVFRYDQCP